MIDALGIIHLNVIVFDDLTHDIILCESSLSFVLIYMCLCVCVWLMMNYISSTNQTCKLKVKYMTLLSEP